MGIDEIIDIVWGFFWKHKIIAGFIIAMIGTAISESRSDDVKEQNNYNVHKAKDVNELRNKVLPENRDRNHQLYYDQKRYDIITGAGFIWMLIGIYQFFVANF